VKNANLNKLQFKSKHCIMRCTLKRPTTSRTFTRASQSPRSKKLLSRLERKERISKWWLRAQVIKKKMIALNVMPKRCLSS
jgi:hypothetical protein